MSKFHLHLTCPIKAEETLCDVVLACVGDAVFSCSYAYEYNAASASLSAEEQVLGRSRTVHLQLLLQEPALTQLLNAVEQQVKGQGIRYWTVPVIHEGQIK